MTQIRKDAPQAATHDSSIRVPPWLDVTKLPADVRANLTPELLRHLAWLSTPPGAGLARLSADSPPNDPAPVNGEITVSRVSALSANADAIAVFEWVLAQMGGGSKSPSEIRKLIDDAVAALGLDRSIAAELKQNLAALIFVAAGIDSAVEVDGWEGIGPATMRALIDLLRSGRSIDDIAAEAAASPLFDAFKDRFSTVALPYWYREMLRQIAEFIRNQEITAAETSASEARRILRLVQEGLLEPEAAMRLVPALFVGGTADDIPLMHALALIVHVVQTAIARKISEKSTEVDG